MKWSDGNCNMWKLLKGLLQPSDNNVSFYKLFPKGYLLSLHDENLTDIKILYVECSHPFGDIKWSDLFDYFFDEQKTKQNLNSKTTK